MPLYEYRCSKCGDVFEVMQKFADAPLTVHEGCGGTVERLISASGFNFKGTGWYVTDYGKNTSHKPHTTATNGDSKPESKSDEKPKSEGKSSESKSKDDKPKKKPSSEKK